MRNIYNSFFFKSAQNNKQVRVKNDIAVLIYDKIMNSGFLLQKYEKRDIISSFFFVFVMWMLHLFNLNLSFILNI